MEDKHCVIVGASRMGNEQRVLLQDLRRNNQFSIAVDGGFDFFDDMGVAPDLWIGDMDSVKIAKSAFERCNVHCLINGIEVIKLEVRKDETDMSAAVGVAFERGYRDITIYGGINGDRNDHTYANIALMHAYSKKGCHISMISDRDVMTVITNDTMQFDEGKKGIISVFSLSDKSVGVTLKGLDYSLEDAELFNDCALGVSNSFTGEKAEVTVTEGSLLLVWER